MRSHNLASVPLAALLIGAAPAQKSACPMLGATYVGHPVKEDDKVTYRFKVESLPKDAEGSAVLTLWRVQSLDRTTGKLKSELRMYQGCTNGRGPCSVAPFDHLKPGEGFYSEVIELGPDFRPWRGDDAAFAIVTYGFGQSDWSLIADMIKPPELTLAKGETEGPDLSRQTVWRLSSCGSGAD